MKQPTTLNPKLYIGIDVHKKSWTFHYQTDLFDGKTITQPAGEIHLINWVNKNFPGHDVSCAYEAGFSGFEAARNFQKENWTVLVLNPADIPTPHKQNVVKSDKVDCRNICRQLINRSVKGIEIPDPEREQFRTLFRERNNLTEGLRKVKAQIKSFLAYYSIPLPEEYDNSHWKKAFIQWLRDQRPKYETGKACLEILIKRYDFMHRELLEISTQLRSYARKHYKKDYDLLKSVPGIGGIVAVAILAEIGDLRKFGRLDELASYVGLVPGVYQSGENSIVKGMTPRAKCLLRSYLIEASWQAVRFDPVLQQYYRSHFGKKPNKIIVKVAHKLLSRIHAVIKTETRYTTGLIK